MKNTSTMTNIGVLFAAIFWVGPSIAAVRLPALISSNMVLQQQSKVKLWGWSDPNEKIVITASWNNQTDSTKGTRDGNWQTEISTPVAGGPYTISIKGNNSILLDN